MDESVKWFRMSGKLYIDPKWRQFAQAAPSAAVLWLDGLSYCADVAGTRMAVKDGFIPRFIATSILCGSEKDIRTLEEAGYWRPDEADDGWIVNGWLNWQRSGEDIGRLRAKRAEAGRKGGRRKAPASKPEANGKQKPSKSEASASRVLGHVASKTNPYTDTEAYTDTETDTDSSFSSSSSPSDESGQRGLVEMDGSWQPDPGSRKWAQETWKGLDIDEARIGFTSHWLGQSKTCDQWERLWRGWLTNHAKAAHARERPAHRHTWLCPHTLEAAGIGRDQAGYHTRLLEYVAAGLNKGYPPPRALARARMAAQKTTTGEGV